MELTRCELEVMDVFWDAGAPLSRKDLLANRENKSWKDSSVHILLNSLLAKEVIHEAGSVKRTKTTARTFLPSMTREQYYATTIFSHRCKPDVMGVLREILKNHELSEENAEELRSMMEKK